MSKSAIFAIATFLSGRTRFAIPVDASVGVKIALVFR
jgi:hypothetical protein